MNDRVPSIGSTIQTRDAPSRAGSSSVSSDSQPASGAIAAKRSFKRILTAMSTSETGELCSLTQVLTGLPNAARALAPASRTTGASAFAIAVRSPSPAWLRSDPGNGHFLHQHRRGIDAETFGGRGQD